MRKRHRPEDETEINITPMLDIVFIMLIFFYRHDFVRAREGAGYFPSEPGS